MAFWQPNTAEKAERLRQLGLYAGPTFLALMLGRAIYEVACDRWRFALVRSREDVGTAAMFILIGLYLGWFARAPLTRLGWIVLAALHAIVLVGPWAGYVPNRWLLNVLYVAFAGLITCAGIRGVTRSAMVFAACTFLAAFTLGYGSRYYADVLLERHSVLRSSPLC